MTEEQAKTLEPLFTADEIRATGADLADVDFRTMTTLRDYRLMVGIPVWLIHNGLTTGTHSRDSQHWKGMAVDWYHTDVIAADKAVECMLRAGFRGVGVYWNGSVKSFHGDLREDFALWRGVKNSRLTAWKYGDLVVVP